jgi:protein arginine N-methyltransferase 2
MVDVGNEEIGVMMGWETPISERSLPMHQRWTRVLWFPSVQETADKLCRDHPNLTRGLRVLNIGFGLGIVSCPTLAC